MKGSEHRASQAEEMTPVTQVEHWLSNTAIGNKTTFTGFSDCKTHVRALLLKQALTASFIEITK